MVFVSDSSGRAFTDYTPNCVVDQRLKSQAKIKNNHDYRLFLQRHGLELIKKQVSPYMVPKCSCKSCKNKK